MARYVRFALVATAVWTVTAWVLAERYVDWNVRDALAVAEAKLGRDMADIATGVERNLAVFHGVPAIVGRDATVRRSLASARDAGFKSLPDPAARRAEWLKQPVLAELNASLARSVKHVRALSALWVIDPEGDCVASSNSHTPESFVAINYADREYFKAAMDGWHGRQFAVGRATGIPGLYFSSPVDDEGRIVGIVAGKIDIPYLSSWVNQANAFVTDVYGVIILAQDPRMVMRALPSTTVGQLSVKQRVDRYRRDEIGKVAITPWGDREAPGLYQFEGGDVPFLLRSHALPTEDLTVTVLQAVPAVATRTQDVRRYFALSAIAGALFLAVASGTAYFVNNYHRVRRYREHRAAIEYLASHDALTGLFSRSVIDALISQGISLAARAGRRLAILFLDLDLFKEINDSMGHEAGDLVLQEVARRLRGVVRASDAVVRHGGDEFVVLLNDLECADDAAWLSGRILEILRTPFNVQGVTLNLTASIGIALYPDDGDSASILLRNADAALYRTKEKGRSDFSFYHASMNADALAHLALDNDLREALEQGQFVLHYQPQYSLSQRRVVGCEALVRWRHPVRGPVLPEAFVAAAEKSRLIVPLGEWVLREACRQAAEWREAGVIDFPVAVNLSAVQFRKPGLAASVERALAESGLPANGLELELTESVVMEDSAHAMPTLLALKGLGIRLSIDDFGTGYSNLGYLKRFEPDVLKIDASFVRDLETDPSDAGIVGAIVGLARSLDYRVVAEGVEKESQWRLLETLGCHEIQGYWFSRPLPAEAFAEFMRRRSWPSHADGNRDLSVPSSAFH